MSASCGPTSPRGSKVNKRKAPSVKESGFSGVTPCTRACSTSLTVSLHGWIPAHLRSTYPVCKVAPRADALGDENWTIFSLIPMLTPEQLSNCVLSFGFFYRAWRQMWKFLSACGFPPREQMQDSLWGDDSSLQFARQLSFFLSEFLMSHLAHGNRALFTFWLWLFCLICLICLIQKCATRYTCATIWSGPRVHTGQGLATLTWPRRNLMSAIILGSLLYLQAWCHSAFSNSLKDYSLYNVSFNESEAFCTLQSHKFKLGN